VAVSHNGAYVTYKRVWQAPGYLDFLCPPAECTSPSPSEIGERPKRREATQATPPPLCPPEMEIAAEAQARGETGTKASGAVEREGRRKRRRGGQGQVPVAVTGSGPRQVQLLRRGPGLAHRGRPSRQDLDACWYLAQRGRHVVSIGPPRRASAGPTRKLMVTATTTPVLSPNPVLRTRGAPRWDSPPRQLC